MNPPDDLERLIAAAQAGSKYQSIAPELVRRIGAQELERRRNFKEAVKATRSKLHQIGAAYLEKPIDYAQALKELDLLPEHPSQDELKEFSLRWMVQHASSRERLPILADFFEQTLGPIAPVRSILDLACGLTPLALPWMPLLPDAPYFACDIFTDLVDFDQRFLVKSGHLAQVELCDLTQTCPQQPVHLALLLKTLPCLEQLEKNTAGRLLDEIQAEHILVSYPARSLGGRAKGMPDHYTQQFEQLAAGRGWEIQTFSFASELAFLITRHDR
jgi:16S rRNA (guanine(1405)-N(7))-methyltransferase